MSVQTKVMSNRLENKTQKLSENFNQHILCFAPTPGLLSLNEREQHSQPLLSSSHSFMLLDSVQAEKQIALKFPLTCQCQDKGKFLFQ